MTITIIMVALMLVIVQSTATTWRRNTERSKSFASSRAAFESMTRTISQATLNTYQDYYDATSPNRLNRASGSLTFVPAAYGRRSELHFITGTNLVTGQVGGAVFFTIPFDYDPNSTNPATGGQLNGMGYFVRYTTNPSLPGFITSASSNPPCYRLFQFIQPTSALKVMNTNFSGANWFTTDVNATPPTNCFPLAQNIVGFAILPKLSDRESTNPGILASDFGYNTRMDWPSTSTNQPTNMHQLPPVVRVVMVALDDTSALRIQSATPPTSALGYDPATIFTNAVGLESSLSNIATSLTAKKLNYRIFRADIPIRAAKWSP
jgi:uncharacterized protein (TIGR02599 family)